MFNTTMYCERFYNSENGNLLNKIYCFPNQKNIL